MVVNPENQDIYVYYYTGSEEFPTLYARRIKDYNHAAFYSTVVPSSSVWGNQALDIGNLGVMKYNKETYQFEEQDVNYNDYYKTSSYYVSSSDTDNKYNTDHSKLGIADPNAVIGFLGVDLQVYIFGYDSITNQDYYITGSLYRYRGAPCFLPTLNTVDTNLVLDLNSFCANIYYPNDTTTDYFVNFRDSIHTLYIKNLTMGSQYTYNFDMDISNISDDGTITVDFNSIISLFELADCDYEMSLISTVYADVYDIQNCEFPVSIKYNYECHYTFSYDGYSFTDFIVVSDSSGDDSILGNPEGPSEDDSKNIFEAILDLPKTIIELLLEALKSLFVPSEDFFTNWIDDLNEYFGDAFGILYYPFELLIDFLNRISTLNDTNTAIISVPAFTLIWGSWSTTIWSDVSYDLNTILENETYYNIHNIYLMVVDIILWLGLIYLASRTISHVLGGMGQAVGDDIYNSDTVQDDIAYQNYSRGQRAQARYNQEQYEQSKKNKKKIGF